MITIQETKFAIIRAEDGAILSNEFISVKKLISSLKRSNSEYILNRALDPTDDFCYIGEIRKEVKILKINPDIIEYENKDK